jgi:hypothetical protein
VAGAFAAAVLSTVATVMLTGAFHEDGLADVADGLGGSAHRDRALEIMKDSRIGAFGAVALVLALGLKFALLAALAGRGLETAAVAIVGAHVLSRLAPLFLIRWLPYVGDSGASKAKPLADAISGGALVVAVAWSVPAVALLLCAHDVVACRCCAAGGRCGRGVDGAPLPAAASRLHGRRPGRHPAGLRTRDLPRARLAGMNTKTLWLQRHAPVIAEPGLCYGATDLEADAQATLAAAQRIAPLLPAGIVLRSSPLRRCVALANAIAALRPDLVGATRCPPGRDEFRRLGRAAVVRHRARGVRGLDR